MNTDTRLARIERELHKVLRKVPPPTPVRMEEAEVCLKYRISAGRLKQLRLGCHKNGKYHPPRLFKWGHINGRRIDYDVEELNKLFKRTIIGTS